METLPWHVGPVPETSVDGLVLAVRSEAGNPPQKQQTSSQSSNVRSVAEEVKRKDNSALSKKKSILAEVAEPFNVCVECWLKLQEEIAIKDESDETLKEISRQTEAIGRIIRKIGEPAEVVYTFESTREKAIAARIKEEKTLTADQVIAVEKYFSKHIVNSFSGMPIYIQVGSNVLIEELTVAIETIHSDLEAIPPPINPLNQETNEYDMPDPWSALSMKVEAIQRQIIRNSKRQIENYAQIAEIQSEIIRKFEEWKSAKEESIGSQLHCRFANANRGPQGHRELVPSE